MKIGVVATVFGVILLAELPDKTMVANVLMGSRNPPLLVWAGSAGAFAVNVVLAVAAGRAIELLPHEALAIVVTALFFAGSLFLLLVPERKERTTGEHLAEHLEPRPRTPWRVVATAFGVVLVGELGDLTQLLLVDFVDKYREPLAAGLGAYAGLLVASAAGAFGGRALLRVLPLDWIRRAGGAVLLGFAGYGVYSLLA